VIVEYAPYGNLRDFLRDRRPSNGVEFGQPASASAAASSTASVVTTEHASLTYKDLVSFGYQVARGVEYLASKLVCIIDVHVRETISRSFSDTPSQAGRSGLVVARLPAARVVWHDWRRR